MSGGRFWRYANKVFGLRAMAGALSDLRPKPQIALSAVWLSVVMMFATRLRSLNALEQQLRSSNRWSGLLGTRRPSDDSVGRVMAQIDAGQLREHLRAAALRLRRNKTLQDNPWPFRVVVLDGHEFFFSESYCCEQCSQRTVQRGGQSHIQHVHRGVVAPLIGFDLVVPLDVEMLGPGEGEKSAARRLLTRLLKRYPRFFDLVAGDALYLEGPMFNLCLQHGKHAMAVLKNNTPALLADAQALFARQRPITRREGQTSVEYWDEENFTTLSSVAVPLRVVQVRETTTRIRVVARRRRRQSQVHTWIWATTVSQAELPARQARQIGHHRWHIENRLFHPGAQHWGMDHCYRHDPLAILNFILTLLLTYLTLQAFYYRNLKPCLRARLSLIQLALQILAAGAPWRPLARAP